MLPSRRTFLALGAGAFASARIARPATAGFTAAAQPTAFKVGVTDWNLRKEANPESFTLGKRLGFDGVQVSLAGGRGAGRTPISTGVVQRYLTESRQQGLPITSTCLNILHTNYLKSDPLGPQRVSEGIALTKALGVEVMLLPFFGEGALKTPEEMDRVADILRELGPDARKEGVVLGLENTISARDNVRIMERSQSPTVLTYYDVGNSTVNGHAVVEELRWLGRERICEVHLKDNPHFMGEGTIDFPAVVAALTDIGFERWAVLETSARADSLEGDLRRNLTFTRQLIAARAGR